MSFWVLPERLEDGKRQYAEFQRQLRFFEEILGPYPFRIDKYGVAHTPYLGMEHQSIIAYGSSFDLNEYGFDWLHFHELAHEWWGNLISASDWRDFWIHEGFAVYMEALYAERLNGHDAYHRYLKRLHPLLNNEEAVAPLESRTTGEIYFARNGKRSDNDIYYKGALILHTLRHLIGEEATHSMLRHLTYPDSTLERTVDGRQTRFVSTADFLSTVENVSGKDLGWFVDVYLRQPDLPKLKRHRDGDVLKLWWDTPNDLPFPMPIDVSIEGATRRVEMADGRAEIRVGEDADVEIDPIGWVLRD
jgi:aminopeptidase N